MRGNWLPRCATWTAHSLQGEPDARSSSNRHCADRLECLTTATVIAAERTRSHMAAAEIINVDVADPPLSLSIAEEEALIVFWWRDYPVGQEWDRGARGRVIEVKPLVDRSVDPEVVRIAREASKTKDANSASSIRTTASLVICTRNRPQELARCLEVACRPNRRAHRSHCGRQCLDGRAKSRDHHRGRRYLRSGGQARAGFCAQRGRERSDRGDRSFSPTTMSAFIRAGSSAWSGPSTRPTSRP